MPSKTKWRMKSKCQDCPFATSGPGLHLRRTLHRRRCREILKGLQRGEHFLCHKTTHETGDGSNLICAGSIEWQEKRGIVSNLKQIMERLDWFAEAARGLGIPK